MISNLYNRVIKAPSGTGGADTLFAKEKPSDIPWQNIHIFHLVYERTFYH